VGDHQLLAGAGEAMLFVPADGRRTAQLCSCALAGKAARRAGGVAYMLKKMVTGVWLTANS